MKRRLTYAIALVVDILLGLLSRNHPEMVPSALGKYPGDALWAMMVYCGFGVMRPEWSNARLSMVALLVSYGDEFTQMYQAPWINHIRATTIGHLILGTAFSWFDMIAYTIGIAIIATLRLALSLRRERAVRQ